MVALLVAALAAVFVYDGTREERIADGVRIGGVDLGGLTPVDARIRLDEQFVDGRRKPIEIDHGEQRFKLGPKAAKIRVNVDQLVRQAVDRSDRGGPFGRTFRRISGGRVDADLAPEITYSEKAVDRLVARVRKDVNRPVEEAELSITASGVSITRGQRGLKVKTGKLREQVAAAIVAPTGATRRFSAETIKLRQKQTEKDLAKANPVVLIASKADHTLRLYKDLKLEKSYGIAVGLPAYPTPSGQFTIANKQVDPVWSVPNSPWAGELGGTTVAGGTAANPLKARWMGITDGVGIHGTSDGGSIGTDASHGCLRMHVPDVIDLFPRVPVGAKVLIV
ncbi:MAG: L,D-transpeptidase/peptidoglycan binding protein [Solirubrobacterales bacterium]|nr:L,D-transpeptidase/peptidoglycan binding protein [Solirubrobacterales bacterium]